MQKTEPANNVEERSKKPVSIKLPLTLHKAIDAECLANGHQKGAQMIAIVEPQVKALLEMPEDERRTKIADLIERYPETLEGDIKGTTIVLDSDLLDSIVSVCDSCGCSRTWLIRTLLTLKLIDEGSEAKGGEAGTTDGKPMIIVLSSYKGGVGKTIVAANLATEYALQGKRVLAIDLDGQGNMSSYFNVYSEEPGYPCITDVLIPGDDRTSKAIEDVRREARYQGEDGRFVTIENLHIVPSNLTFDNADSKLKGTMLLGTEYRLRDAIEKHLENYDYDYIIIDCPPKIDLVTTNAVVALAAGRPESMVIIPVRPGTFSRAGMEKTVDVINVVAASTRSQVPTWVLLRNNSEPRTTAWKMLEDEVRSVEPTARFLNTRIDRATIVVESEMCATPMAFYADNTKTRGQFIALSKEIEAMANGK